MHQPHFQQHTQGRDSVEKEAEYVADEEGCDHQEDATTRTTPAPLGLPGGSSYQESNSESDRHRSPPTTTEPKKAIGRKFEGEK